MRTAETCISGLQNPGPSSETVASLGQTTSIHQPLAAGFQLAAEETSHDALEGQRLLQGPHILTSDKQLEKAKMNVPFKTEILWGKEHLRQGDEFCPLEETPEAPECQSPADIVAVVQRYQESVTQAPCAVFEKSGRHGLHCRKRKKM